MEHWVIQGAASACLAWLAITGVVYLVVFLSRRRGEHGWLAVQSLLAAAYPLWMLGLSGPLEGGARVGVLGGALTLASAASVAFTHAHFGLPAPGRTWSSLAALGVAAGVLARCELVPRDVMTTVALLVIAAAVAHQIETLWRLARGAAGRLNAQVLLGAWMTLGATVAIDVARWLAGGGAPDEPEQLSASLVGLSVLAFLYTIALARQHGVSLEQAERQSRELEARLATIEAKSREIEKLNRELRHQIGLRSRQLSAALATLGARAGGLATGAEIAGRYRVLGHLGTGGMGIVYEVERLTDARRLALKLLHGHARPEVVARFAREAEILAQLHHPNLVEIVDIDISADGQLFIVMELVEGMSLALACDGDRDLAWRVHVLTEIAAGLIAIHGAGIVHRDLKPANVLIADGGPTGDIVKIADFGVSSVDPHAPPGDRAIDPAEQSTLGCLTAPGVIVGTPRYLAPELVRGASAATAPVDIFSFGVLAYELLGGRPPHHDNAFAQRLQGGTSARPRSLAELVPGMPLELVALVHDCLSPERDDRPTAVALVQRLRALPAMPALTPPVKAREPAGPTAAYGEDAAETGATEAW